MCPASLVGIILLVFAVPPSPADRDELWIGKVKTDRSIMLEVTVEASPAEVFELWTTVEGIKKFFASDARINLVPGGAYTIIFRPDEDPEGEKFGTKGARILAFERGRSLAFEWKGKPGMTEMRASPLPTWVELTFAPVAGEPDRTLVKFASYGFGEGGGWDEAYRYFGESAWPSVLRQLKEYCAGAAKTERAPSVSGGTPASSATNAVPPADVTARPALTPERPARKDNQPVYYAAFMTQGLNWKPFAEWDPQLARAHLDYMRSLATAGSIVMAGPFLDDSGGLTILRADSLEDARRIMAAEPCAKAGILQVDVHPWLVAMETPGRQSKGGEAEP